MKLSGVERLLVRLNNGRPFAGMVSRLPANNYQYKKGSVRRVERYGIRFELDISDLVQWYLYFGFVDPSHEALVAQCRPGDTVIDVGANIGITAMRISSLVGPTGQIHAFEPDRNNREQLERSLARNGIRNVKTYPIALGARKTTGFLRRSAVNSGMSTVNLSPALDAEQVQVLSLDEVFSGNQLSRLDMIKIDVEGAESAVVLGAQSIIRRFRPKLFAEVDDANLRRHDSSAKEFLATIAGLGYSVQSIGGGNEGTHFDALCTPV